MNDRMKILMVLYDMQKFGGLESLATDLAVILRKKGHKVSILSTAWVSSSNQYLSRLLENDIPLIQPPKWLSLLASDNQTKERLLSIVLWLLKPVIYLLGIGIFLIKKRFWSQSIKSSYGWLHGMFGKCFIIPDWRKPIVKCLLTWCKLFRKFDVMHLHGYTSSLLFVLDWASSNQIPVVYEEHTTPTLQFDWWKDFSLSINKADVVIAVSKNSASALHEVCGINQPIMVLNPLLVDPFISGMPEDFRSTSNKGIITVTTVARLYIAKGLNYLLEAISNIYKKHENVRFRVFGDGELRQDLYIYAEKLGLHGENIFVGSFNTQEELTEIMTQTDIVVIPSIFEGQPLALVEAMAYGCPIVATSVGGIPELIEDGVNGLLCEPGDPECLASRICSLIESPQLRARLGQQARKSYEKGPFHPDMIYQELLAIYTCAIQKDNVLACD